MQCFSLLDGTDIGPSDVRGHIFFEDWSSVLGQAAPRTPGPLLSEKPEDNPPRHCTSL